MFLCRFDSVSKSANYCFVSSKDYSTHGCMLLCEVALGESHELLQADHGAAALPAGKHSTRGVGRSQPHAGGAVTLADGLTVPCGAIETKEVPGAALQYNEFVVYDTSQIKLKYLVKVKFIHH